MALNPRSQGRAQVYYYRSQVPLTTAQDAGKQVLGAALSRSGSRSLEPLGAPCGASAHPLATVSFDSSAHTDCSEVTDGSRPTGDL